MGVLNSFGRFGASAFAPVLLNLSIIALSFFSDFFPNPAIALSVGVVIGGVLQILIQIPSLLRTGWRLRWFWDLAHPGVRRVAALIGPRLFGIGIVQIDVLVGTQFASHMIEGSVASIGLADRVMELVLGGYAIALSTAVLPLLARQAAANRMEDMKGTLTFAMRLILFITLPATVGLILLRVPIIEVLFEGGEFDAQSTALTAWALMFFAVGLSAFSMIKDHRSGVLCAARYVDSGGHWHSSPSWSILRSISFSFAGSEMAGLRWQHHWRRSSMRSF